MKVSINKYIINKNEQKAHQSKNFEPFDLTPEQLAANISTVSHFHISSRTHAGKQTISCVLTLSPLILTVA